MSKRTGMVNYHNILNTSTKLNVQRGKIFEHWLRMSGHCAEDQALADVEGEDLLWQNSWVCTCYCKPISNRLNRLNLQWKKCEVNGMMY